MDYKKDYYQILEIQRSSTKAEIRAAYRRLAKLYHPDNNTGNREAEEMFKLINEAHEILSNEILKQDYDSYRAGQEKWQKAQSQSDADIEVAKQANKRTYTKTHIVTSERRIYIRGEIRVKYWADCEDQAAASHERILDYKIHPTEAEIKIAEQNIFPQVGVPRDYLKAYKESDIFAVAIPQPIRCEVGNESGKQYFDLTISDIRIRNIKLEGVTKHENKSYGTLTGQFYGYSSKLDYEEVKVTVTECFGDTGEVEEKEENGFTFIRKQYYHPDCSTYWGNWVRLPKADDYQPRQATKTAFTKHVPAAEPGCGLLAGICALLGLLFFLPQLFVVYLVLIALALLIYFGGTFFSSPGRFLSFLVAGLLLVFLIAAARSLSYSPDNNYVKKKAAPRKIRTLKSVRKKDPSNDVAANSPDSFITHFLQWQDYAGKSYEAGLTISLSALRNAKMRHDQMKEIFYGDFSLIYKAMLEPGEQELIYVYQAFDSLRATNEMDEAAFAQLLVSSVQSLPYYLVVDKDCDYNYGDDFIHNYLANCKTDCCIGNELFGVRSPVEFISDLKGDCDTRSLLLYQLFKHYNYDVALLTSSYYKHAMIAVHFTVPVKTQGLTITINDQQYYMWETTSPGLNYGQISSDLNNLNFWGISLLNKKI